jgi:hypothetical protein
MDQAVNEPCSWWPSCCSIRVVNACKQISHSFGYGESVRRRPPLAELADDVVLPDAIRAKVKETPSNVV